MHTEKFLSVSLSLLLHSIPWYGYTIILPIAKGLLNNKVNCLINQLKYNFGEHQERSPWVEQLFHEAVAADVQAARRGLPGW